MTVVCVYCPLVFVVVFIDNNGKVATRYDPNLCICRQFRDTTTRKFQLFNSAMILVSLLFIFAVYARLYSIAQSALHANSQNESHKNLKALQCFTAVTIAFVCAWVPTIIHSVYTSVTGRTVHYAIEFFVYWLSFSGSWWDVAILTLINPTFRQIMFEVILMRSSKKNLRPPMEFSQISGSA